jgi:hypothetical protein
LQTHTAAHQSNQFKPKFALDIESVVRWFRVKPVGAKLALIAVLSPLKTGTLGPTPGAAFREGSRPDIQEIVERKNSKTFLA